MQQIIESLWEDKSNTELLLSHKDKIQSVLQELDAGRLRVSEKDKDGQWFVNQWIKKAILLSFRVQENRVVDEVYYDKVALKFKSYQESDFQAQGARIVPGAVVRFGSYIEPGAILMPSFINVGAYVGAATMIDTWATVGSCAQIGKNCHISGGVGIGGVLEPLQANPVIIEDDVFIGARSEVAEGVIVEKGAVISMGVFIGASTRIYDRQSGQISYGRIPAYSVVVPGMLPSSDGITYTSAAIIVKKVDEQTRSKTSVNDLLRP